MTCVRLVCTTPKPSAAGTRKRVCGEDYLGYTFRDPLPLGHGEKSLYQIARFIRLEDHEALAIRWHMGAYDAAAHTDLRDLSAAMDATPWVWRLHEADMCAAHIDERGTDE